VNDRSRRFAKWHLCLAVTGAVIAGLVTALIVSLQTGQSRNSNEHRERRLRALVTEGLALTDDRTAIPICFGPTTDIFPQEWLLPPHNAKAGQLLPPERERAVSAIRSAMMKYPPSLLAGNVRAVYIVRSLEFDGISAGATNSADEVYIADDEVQQGFTDEWLERAFHHEFSSILLRNYEGSFREADWLAANPAGFRYGESGVDSIKAGRASEEPVPEQHQQGFLHEYGRGALEDDFNSFAESLFSNSRDFWKAVDRFEGVRKKTQLAIEFYHSLDPSFTEAMFRNLD